MSFIGFVKLCILIGTIILTKCGSNAGPYFQFIDWNILPQSAIDCETVDSFKQTISRD